MDEQSTLSEQTGAQSATNPWPNHPNTVALIAVCGGLPCGQGAGLALGPNHRAILTAAHVIEGISAQAEGVYAIFNLPEGGQKSHYIPLGAQAAASTVIYDPQYRTDAGIPDLGAFLLPKTPAELGLALTEVTFAAGPPTNGSTTPLSSQYPAVMFVAFGDLSLMHNFPDSQSPATTQRVFTIDSVTPHNAFRTRTIDLGFKVDSAQTNSAAGETAFAGMGPSSSGGPLYTYAHPLQAGVPPTLVVYGVLSGPITIAVEEIHKAAQVQRDQQSWINTLSPLSALHARQALAIPAQQVTPTLYLVDLKFSRVDAQATHPNKAAALPAKFIEFLLDL